MTRKRILLTVLTQPRPSSSYDDSFCTAGFLDDGSMIRIYPVPFYRYEELHKYSIIELNLRKRTKGDFRPESFTPVNLDLQDMKIVDLIGTDNAWEERRKLCLKNVYTDFKKLIIESRDPLHKSLAVIKPSEILDFIVEKEDEIDWKPSQIASQSQFRLFATHSKKINLEKLPYKFIYHFKDSAGISHKLKILDWEIGVLYRNCLKSAEGNEQLALEKVTQKYFDKFKKLDLYFFVGTTLEWHLRKSHNPFTIIGVFYPPFAPLKLSL